jgi:hypothetical protein
VAKRAILPLSLSVDTAARIHGKNAQCRDVASILQLSPVKERIPNSASHRKRPGRSRSRPRATARCQPRVCRTRAARTRGMPQPSPTFPCTANAPPQTHTPCASNMHTRAHKQHIRASRLVNELRAARLCADEHACCLPTRDPMRVPTLRRSQHTLSSIYMQCDQQARLEQPRKGKRHGSFPAASAAELRNSKLALLILARMASNVH